MLASDVLEDRIVLAVDKLQGLRVDFEGMVGQARSAPLDVAPFVEFASTLDEVIASLLESVTPPAGSSADAAAESAYPASPPTAPGDEDNEAE